MIKSIKKLNRLYFFVIINNPNESKKINNFSIKNNQLIDNKPIINRSLINNKSMKNQ